MKYHLGHGSAYVTVGGGVATGAVAMRTEIAIAHLKLKMDGADYKRKVTMDVSNTMTVSPAGDFSGSGNGITIAAGTSGDRYVTLIPTEATSVSFSGSATGSMTFGHGIQANNLYGMAAGIEVTLNKVPVTSVSLAPTSLSLEEGKTETLTATVAPNNATYKDVTWKSSDETKATVDQNGLVTAVGAGTATITVTATNGTDATDDDKTATCTVTVTPAHEYVDLGLPSRLLWATCNVGADKPEGYGDYFAWGETETKNTYNYNTYKWFNNGNYKNIKKYNTKSDHGTVDNKTTLDPEDDAAHVKWGGNWRMPTSAEWQELYSNTNSTWTTKNGVYGRKFTSKKDTTKYIFLPAAGQHTEFGMNSVGSDGRYWSSSLYSSDPGSAYSMYFNSSNVNSQCYNVRINGFQVRPVRAAR